MNSTRFASRATLSVALSLTMCATLSACGASTDTAPPSPSATTDAGRPDAADASTWPRTVTLTLDGSGLDLATGALSRTGDLSLNTSRVIDLTTRDGVEGLCPVGTHPSLEAIPTATDACRTYQNAWVSRVGVLQYSASATDSAVGTSILARDAARVIYRLRIVRDVSSYARTAITVEYAPIP
jgi:hypothetical protein